MTEWARTKNYGDWWFIDNYVTHKHKLHSRIMVLCSQFPDLWSFTLLLTKLQWNNFHINYISRRWLKVTRLARLIACLGVMRLSMSCPTYPMSCTGGDYRGFARVFDKFPILGDNLMLHIPYILYRDSKNNENSWTNAPTLGTNYADKSLQIPTHYPTWGRWGWQW